MNPPEKETPMLIEQTLEKLHALKLQGMVDALAEQRGQPDVTDLDFEDRLALLVERQWLWRQSRALATRLTYAGFKQSASLEDINYRHPRGLKRAHIDQLVAADWVGQGRRCLITGPTGTGKSYLGCALGHRGCRDGYRVIYAYTPRLFRELKASHLDGQLPRKLKKLIRADLLIVDDLGIADASIQQYRDLLEILDDRAGKATLVTSQLPVAEWHTLVGEPTVADALLDRLVHGAYRIELSGPSLRKDWN